MSNDIKISIKEHLGDNRYIDYPLTLKCKTPIVIETSDSFIWEGEYKGELIKVVVEKGDTSDFAIIEGTEGINIDEEIRAEIYRILRKLN